LEVGNFSLASHAICMQKDNAILKDGFRSFPSGHSSSAFAGLFYLSLYLTGKMHVLDSRGEVWKTLIVLIPSLGAALVAGSRIMDARHHPFDVLSGSLLGILVGWAAYRQFFPSPSDYRAKGRAYPIRTWGRISEDYQPYTAPPYESEPLRQNEQPHAGYSSGRNSPIQAGGNVFRNEINHSQRVRRQDSALRGTPSSVYTADPSQTDTLPPPIPRLPVETYTAQAPGQVPVSNPFARTGSRRLLRRDDWDDSTDEEEEGLELQHSYTLSQPSGHEHYDGTGQNPFDTQDTAYKAPPGGAPLSHLAGVSVHPLSGDLGSGVPPQAPPHGQQPERGVQLYDGPPR